MADEPRDRHQILRVPAERIPQIELRPVLALRNPMHGFRGYVTVARRRLQQLRQRDGLRYRNHAERHLRTLGHHVHRRTRPGERRDRHRVVDARELQIARLVVDRRTNREVAAELVVSQKTVETHLRNISTRWAWRHGASPFKYKLVTACGMFDEPPLGVVTNVDQSSLVARSVRSLAIPGTLPRATSVLTPGWRQHCPVLGSGAAIEHRPPRRQSCDGRLRLASAQVHARAAAASWSR